MFIDEAEIVVKGGSGGNGNVSFFNNRGGPSGGNGGRGGNVYAILNNNAKNLRKYVEKKVFEAEPGGLGARNRCHGLNGKDLELQVPNGTTIIDLKNNYEIEINCDNPRILLCRGGQGGLGNDAFKSSINRSPRKFEPGKAGQEKKIRLILKLIADYGLIGLPNAGKSSLLNILTTANVKVANYQFTTLEPNLGVIEGGKIIADIPGLIEGASDGKGLGIKFLKHIEKVKVILHCITSEIKDVVKTYKVVRNELGQYNQKMLEKKEIILLTKIDLLSENEIKKKVGVLKKLNKNILPISILDEKSIRGLLKEIRRI